METDIKKIIEQVLGKLKNDEGLVASFTKDPVKAIEGIIGVDLPDDQIKTVIEAVKKKLAADGGKGLLNKIEGLFKK